MTMPSEYYLALRTFLPGPQTMDDLPQVYGELLRLGWIEAVGVQQETADVCYNNRWDITPAGRLALSEFENVSNEQAKQERQNRTENYIGIANVVVPALTFVAGLLVEH